MNDFTYNKAMKDKKLYEAIRKTVNKVNLAKLDMSQEDFAHELGLAPGTLTNKLKSSYDTGDINLTEYLHILEITEDYRSLDYIAREFDFMLVPQKTAVSTCQDINTLTDKASIENSDVFRTVKQALEDGVITYSEQEKILKEIDEEQTVIADLKASVLNLKVRIG